MRAAAGVFHSRATFVVGKEGHVYVARFNADSRSELARAMAAWARHPDLNWTLRDSVAALDAIYQARMKLQPVSK